MESGLKGVFEQLKATLQEHQTEQRRQAEKEKEQLHSRNQTIVHNTGEAPADPIDPETGKNYKEAAKEWKEKSIQLDKILKEISK